MAVMTALQKSSEPKGQDIITKKHTKSYYKTRPITATLDHPLILDIKLLKKLDMTTFTKKGLIALSKFCGISLINKTDTKKKLNKCVKTIHYSQKQSGSEGNESSLTSESNKNYRSKRKLGKQVAKGKPRIRFKIAKEETDEDSLDVICKKHKKVLKPCIQITNSGMNGKVADRKSVIDSILNGTKENVIPEPCKTCSRSEHPERFHSHPKSLIRLSLVGETNEKNLEERFRNVVTTKEEKEEMKKSTCAKEDEVKPLQESCAEQNQKNASESRSSKLSSKSPSISSVGTSSPETGKKSKPLKKSLTPSSSSATSKSEILKKTNSKIEMNQKDENNSTTGEEDLRFVTGCYICGKQVSPKLRINHEKTCIAEWRSQNSLVSPDKRKPEPKRPDYRFTGSGDLDYEGTFESIWANHMDSLVPCKKCGRKFFPDRIEKHENCCNNIPISVKYKH